MTEELLGVTTCPTCKKRFRVPQKYQSFIGKSIKCPKCKRPFVIEIQTPSPIEQAAMATSAADVNGQSGTSSTSTAIAEQKTKKRTRAEVRKAAFLRIRKEFRPFLKQLEAISECGSYSEEKVRVWCFDVLRKVLGYKDEDLDLELTAVNKRIDIAIKHDGNVLLIIECKKGNTPPPKARKQAVNYAMARSANWAIVTNGQNWELHRVIPVHGQDPLVVEVFNISLLDDDGLSMYDAERLYLITKRALLRGETEKEFHRARCLENERLWTSMLSDRAVSAIRRSLVAAYKKEFRQALKITDDDVYEALQELTRPSDLDE
jgi:uncharacterized protein YbaR (Trm112 family)